MKILLITTAFLLGIHKPSFCQIIFTKEEIEKDSLLSLIIRDSAFINYVSLSKINFDRISKGITPKVPEAEISTSGAKNQIEELRAKGIKTPEFVYYFSMKSSFYIKQIVANYPKIKSYPSGTLGGLLKYSISL
jgi:hypothetical protein